MSDPQIRQAAELIATLEDEVEEEREETQQTDAPKTAIPTEGILDDFDLAVGQTAFKYTQSPTFQKILKIGGPVLGLAMVATMLTQGGAFDPQDGMIAANLISKAKSANLADTFQTAFGATADMMHETEISNEV